MEDQVRVGGPCESWISEHQAKASSASTCSATTLFGSNLSHVRRRTRFSIGRRAVIRLAEGLLGDANGGLFRVVIEVVEARLQVLIGAAGRVRPEQLGLQDHNLAIRLLGVTTTSRPASVR